MNRNLVLLLLSMALLASAISCDGPTSQTSGGGSRPRVASNDSGVMVINGEPITASEILASPAVRKGLRQIIYFHNLRKIAAEEGVTADADALEEHVSLVKQRLTERGDTWEGYLSELALTEDEYRSNIEESLLQDAIVEKRVGVTDEKMQKVWADQQEKVIDEYMTTNYLPDSDRGTVTYEMCHDILFAKVMRIEGVPVLGDLNKELIDTSSLTITCMSDEERARLYEFLILESVKTDPGTIDGSDSPEGEENESAPAADSETAEDGGGTDVDSSIGG